MVTPPERTRERLYRGDRGAGHEPHPTPSEDREFVPKHDDFQVLKIGRPNAEGSKLQNPSKRQVTEREEHEASTLPANIGETLYPSEISVQGGEMNH